MKDKMLGKFLQTIILFLLIGNQVGFFADEGLWHPNAIPAGIKNQYGLTDDEIQKIQAATLKFSNAGTGVFVSPDGLILTNQHVAKDFVQKISSAEKPYIDTGFLAKTNGEELKLPEIEVSTLMFQKDVTDFVNQGIDANMPPSRVIDMQIGRSREIAARTQKETGFDCEVFSLFDGEKHMLYAYKKYRDVRLVFLPEKSIAIFGGGNDNFEFPRHWLDIAFVRVYENDKPLKNNRFIAFSKNGVKGNDKLITAGFPTSTERNLMSSQLEYLQNTEMPMIIKKIQTDLKGVNAFAQMSRENAVEAESQRFELENSLKAIQGRLAEMKKADLLSRRKAEEQKSLANVKETAVKEAIENVAQAYKNLSQFEAERKFLDLAWGFDTALFYPARMHVRWALEKDKPQAERSPGYNEQRLAQFENIMRTTVAEPAPNEEQKLTYSLALMRETLGAEHPTVKKIFQDKTPEQLSKEILKSKLTDQEFRIELLEKGSRGIIDSTDPMIVLMRWIDTRALELRGKYQTDFFSLKNKNYPKAAGVFRQTRAIEAYPDADSSLRFSFGRVSGYKDDGKQIQPFTITKDLLKKARENDFKPPYDLQPVWRESRKTINSKTPFNFALTNDISGGNSGSPVIDSEGNLVGLIFDSNIHALIWSYKFDETQGRSVAVDARAITDALNLYQAENLLAEIGGSK